MADAHAEGGEGGSPYSFLYILGGALIAALVFHSIRTSTPLFSIVETKHATSSLVSAIAPTHIVKHTQKQALPRKSAREHWTTITLDQNNEVMSILEYDRAIDRE